MSNSAISKRKRRRDRGKLKQQRYVLVHYFRYYGYYDYLPAALEFLDSEDASRLRSNTETWKLYWGHHWSSLISRHYISTFNTTVAFDSFDDAVTHVIERKLRMLPETGVIPGWPTYTLIPWKITEQYGRGKTKRYIRVKLLGTK